MKQRGLCDTGPPDGAIDPKRKPVNGGFRTLQLHAS